MAISFAGVDLLLKDPGGMTAAFLEQYLDPTDLVFPSDTPTAIFEGRGDPRITGLYSAGLPTPNWKFGPCQFKLNRLWWPTGASRYACGLFLCTDANLTDIIKELGDGTSATLKMESVSDSGTQTIEPTMHLLPPRRMAHPDGAEVTSWLLPLVDERFFWQWKNVGDLALTSSDTWSGLITTLAAQLGVAIANDAPSANYFVPDWRELTRRYENAAMMLDAVANSIGQRVTVQIDGSVECRNWDTAKNQLLLNFAVEKNNRGSVIAGGRSDRLTVAHYPDDVISVFPKRASGLPHCDGDLWIETDDLDANQTSTGTEKVFFSTAIADFTTLGSTPDNSANIESLAGQIQTDYEDSLDEHYDVTFCGLKHGWVPTGYDDAIEYAVHQTRIKTFPHDFGVCEQLSQFSNAVITETKEVLRVEKATGSALVPGSSGSFFLVTWNGSTWAATSIALTVHDPFNRNYILPGERIWATVNCDSDKIEAVGENGLRRVGKSDGTINTGSSGTVSIFKNGVDTTFNVTGVYDWADTGADNLAATDEVFVHFQPGENLWRILPFDRVGSMDVEEICPTLSNYQAYTTAATDTISVDKATSLELQELIADTTDKLLRIRRPPSSDEDGALFMANSSDADNPRWGRDGSVGNSFGIGVNVENVSQIGYLDLFVASNKLSIGVDTGLSNDLTWCLPEDAPDTTDVHQYLRTIDTNDEGGGDVTAEWDYTDPMPSGSILWTDHSSSDHDMTIDGGFVSGHTIDTVEQLSNTSATGSITKRFTAASLYDFCP